MFDPGLSMLRLISCNTLHNLPLDGTDNLKTSVGYKWRPRPVSSPAIFKLNQG
ncbi:cytochrome c peroxidase [Rheinheimera sediminis]|uniref:cytochrome c peroxidase n=1 Tax=Rheinheimera sp. YQF-1 TaxID=2499626 RepID=UPI0039657830